MVQDLAEHRFSASEKQVFLNTLTCGEARAIAHLDGHHRRDRFFCSWSTHTSGDFAHIKLGRCKGCAVAATDNFDEIRKVSRKLVFAIG
jgi:hypothetical protein